MRFQQLKRNSNAVLKQRLYKSGKNWIVKSTLSLVGGLVLFGISQGTVVKADSAVDTTPVAEPDATVNESKTDSTAEIGQPKTDAGSGNTADIPASEPTKEALKVADSQTESKDTPEAPTPVQSEPTTSEISSGDWGTVHWTISDDGGANGVTLHLGGGTLDNTTKESSLPNEPWKDYKSSVKTIAFGDDEVIAGTSVTGLFSDFTKVTQIKGLDKLNTSQTTDMSYLFKSCKSLESLDVSSLDVSNVSDFSYAFCNLQSIKAIDISNWQMDHGVNFKFMFFGNEVLNNLQLPTKTNSVSVADKSKINFSDMLDSNGALTSIDISNLDMTGTRSVARILNECPNIQELRVSPKNNLTAAGLSFASFPDENGIKAVGWEVTDTEDKNILIGTYQTTMGLMNFYPGSSTEGDLKTTWKWDYESPMEFKVKYVSQDDPSGEPFYTSTDYITGHYPREEFQPQSLNSLGVDPECYYSAMVPATVILTKDLDKGFIEIPVPKKQVTIQVDEEDSKTGIKHLTPINIPITGSKITIDDIKNDFDQISNKEIIPYDENTKTGSYLEMNDNTIYFTEKNLAELGTVGIKKDAQSLTKGVVDILVIQQSDGILPESGSGKTITFHFLFEPEVNNNSNSGGGSSTVDRGIEAIEGTVGTHFDEPEVQLYDDDGVMITDRKVAPSSDWYTDKSMTLKNEKYYRVATNQWAKASDVYLYYANNVNVLVHQATIAGLKTSQGQNVTDRALQANSGWYSDRYTYLNDVKYYRVATNEFVSSDNVQEY
ncbi:BspA family leucine-rich repeat surface protein [Companilactobacillus huachuanensis]|uniref:BspA family leucine-rich repeat surface protein n=1 Tax=Companilactobacillus huachuanensis TaxID=2559914 RepID=A0ABW1RMV4_9LACO|nr:BspA family leucine-rich repeat surface protein [Companilactobacillus huachuanensis]